MPVEMIKGDNVVTCVYKLEPNRYNYTHTNETLHLFSKIKIDFDLNSSDYCYAKGFKFGKKLNDYKDYRHVIFNCNKHQEEVQCEVVK